ncbi:hypothetical protein AU467_18680 [Mesorhizobium loti]|uniref:Uncharacterized protein n=1 Tax=Rhizobium loti TaxID=381 RepID=A0A117N3P7_RHILI|nr:hypothetical protein AU467_18680 [Mesorhizobium loti]
MSVANVEPEEIIQLLLEPRLHGRLKGAECSMRAASQSPAQTPNAVTAQETAAAIIKGKSSSTP